MITVTALAVCLIFYQIRFLRNKIPIYFGFFGNLHACMKLSTPWYLAFKEVVYILQYFLICSSRLEDQHKLELDAWS